LMQSLITVNSGITLLVVYNTTDESLDICLVRNVCYHEYSYYHGSYAILLLLYKHSTATRTTTAA